MPEDKNRISSTENGETRDKKSLITEKITGRKLTLSRAGKYTAVAAMCGAAFGLAASLTFCGVNMLSNMSYNAGNKTSKSDEQLHMTDIEGNDVMPPVGTEPESIGEANVSTDLEGSVGSVDGTVEDQGQPGGDMSLGNADVNGKTETHENPGSPADDGLTGQAAGNGSGAEAYGTGTGTGAGELNRDEADENAAEQSFSEMRASAIESSQKYFVTVSATSTGTTWFDNEESNTETFSGVITTVGRNEILILTTSGAAQSESVRVKFHNGVSVDAFVKQFSNEDGLCVLAVSTESGLDEHMLNELEGIEFAARDTIENGEAVIACGSPLGVSGSYSFGDIGYINDSEAGYDVSQRVAYTDALSDAGRGTFFIDYEGRLIGIAGTGAGSSGVDDGLSRIVTCYSLNDTVNALKAGEKIAYTGVMGADVTFDMKYSGIPEGCYVTGVDQDSPAYTAGIMRGDIVSSVNGDEIGGMGDYQRAVRRLDPGASLEIILKRPAAGEYRDMTFTVTAGER